MTVGSEELKATALEWVFSQTEILTIWAGNSNGYSDHLQTVGQA